MNIIISPTHPDGSPTYFKEKIWASLLCFNILTQEQFNKFFDGDKNTFVKVTEMPKHHAILTDAGHLWKSGTIIQIVYNDIIDSCYRQIIPDIRCFSVQKIQIKYKQELSTIPIVFIDDKNICASEVETLAINEGFDNADMFYNYFNEDFLGRIIHWTNLRYTK